MKYFYRNAKLWFQENRGKNRGKIVSLIASFLKDRRQFVYHNRRTTSKRLITTGVPQGSVLGPFLFIPK